MKLPQDLGARLASSFGLDPNLCQGPGLGHVVTRCCEEWCIPGPDALFTELRSSQRVFNAFAEELLIPESWFFRDRAPFLFLKEWVSNIWLPTHPEKTLKVLSLPCSCGQEPYSAAITLLEAGLPPERFSIIAGDLSPKLLEQAKTGRYRAMAFRGTDCFPRARYFVEEEGCHLRVRDEVRERVSFHRMNLLEPQGYAGEAPFDVIFCRNVLIYFDEKGRKWALRGLEQALAADGLLCVGHADALSRITDKFERTGSPGAFTYRRKPGELPSAGKAVPQALPRKALMRPAPAPLPKFAKPASVPSVFAPIVPSEIGKAHALADCGELSSAEQLCRNKLKVEPGSVEWLYLLAEVLLAQKKVPDGEAQLRRVVYLQPGHTDALFRLALLAEQRGDTREAANWRRRATKRQLEAQLASHA